jgi:hypothetical protein
LVRAKSQTNFRTPGGRDRGLKGEEQIAARENELHMSEDVDEQRRDAELDRAIEKFLRECMADGLTREEALELFMS